MRTNAGRKPIDADRFPCGKLRPETPEEIIATALWARLRDGLTYDQAVIRDERGTVTGANQDGGHTLGRLRLLGQRDPGGISETQYHTGMSYAHLVRRHAGIMGYSIDSRSPGFELVSRETGDGKPTEERVVLTVRRQFSDCYRILMDAGRTLGQGTRVATTTYDACLDRIRFRELRDDMIALGNLKAGLNELGRVLR